MANLAANVKIMTARGFASKPNIDEAEDIPIVNNSPVVNVTQKIFHTFAWLSFLNNIFIIIITYLFIDLRLRGEIIFMTNSISLFRKNILVYTDLTPFRKGVPWSSDAPGAPAC